MGEETSKTRVANLLSMFDKTQLASGEFLFAQAASRTAEQSCPSLTLSWPALPPDSEALAMPFLLSKSNISSSS